MIRHYAIAFLGLACLGIPGCGRNCAQFNGKTSRVDLQALTLTGGYSAENSALAVKDSATAVLTVRNGDDVYEFTYEMRPSGTAETMEHIGE